MKGSARNTVYNDKEVVLTAAIGIINSSTIVSDIET